ncbi:Cyclic nucleotide-gated cation channel beta-3, partial [Trichinella nelsoni]
LRDARMKQGVVQACVCQLNYTDWDDNTPNGGGEESFFAIDLRSAFKKSIDRHCRQYLLWLAFVTLCFAYNAIVIPLRCSFFVQDASNSFYWFVFDYLCDLVYILDMVLVKCRLQVVQSGITITDLPTLRKHYLKSWLFKTDLLSLLPLDLLYILPSLRFKSTLRLPRMLKITSFWELFALADSACKNPFILRIGKLYSYVVYMIHCNACIYYLLSFWIGIGSNVFLYDGCGNAYLRCFYFATKLGISIGNNPDPTNVIECIYMICCWMMGTFAFAMLLGQIYDIISTANKIRDEFKHAMDSAIQLCKQFDVPKELQEKVRQWFTYTWKEQKILNESTILDKLPTNLQIDMTISVNYDMLQKVELFQECEKGLLRDLVLKLQSVVYLPGDFVCRKNEVGREMYIVSKGVLLVYGGVDGHQLLSTLHEGSVFGEISLLSVSKISRRTADVRSRGFSTLFVLNKGDFYEIMKDYPSAKLHLETKARELLARDNLYCRKQI